jgi:hypothetical protein
MVSATLNGNDADFEFHQVQYSRKERGFKVAPLGLVHFQ